MYIQPRTLADTLWPRPAAARMALLVVVGSLLIAFAAQVRIPLWPVPVTGQTFGVLLVAALLGRRAIASVLLYLGYGLVGLPVFAGGAAGAGQLAGPTGGYLLGFAAAAWLVGWLCEQAWDRRFHTAVLAMLLGNIVIYACGLLWLSRFVPWPETLGVGLLPFLPGDILKIVLAAGLLPLAWRTLGARGSR